MFKLSKSHLLLFLIVVFSFLYRVFLMLWASYPPGADIGLHNSIIHSITQSGNTNFLWNYYHMGAGVSLTFPGYHIFVSYIILMTGLPDTLAHALIASLFSSLIVVVAFLITRKVWAVTAALIVAFLVAFSRFDIEMLMWSGYPNVVALMLIPLTFYVFLQREKFPLPCFVVVTSLLSGAIFLTHSLSAVIFVGITFSTFVLGTVFSSRFGVRRTHFFIWLLPLILGAIIISPFLVAVVPVFLGAYTGTFIGGVSDIRLALLSTQTLTLDYVLPLLLCIFLIFLFSRKYQGKFFSVSALLLSMWILIPAIGTQGYLVGFYTDYSRFKYFVYLPVIITFGLVIDYASHFLAKVTEIVLSKIKALPQIRASVKKKLSPLRLLSTRKTIYVSLVTVFLLYSLLSVSIFAVPSEGVKIQNFYQVMNDPLFEAVQWAHNHTPADSVFVADSLYGWWFSGFAQRQTLSASDPQQLILPREIEPAKNAKNLLDTDYILDNGLIQVREDGGYIGRHNPMFLAKLSNSYFPYALFHFNNDEMTILCREGNDTLNFELSQLSVKDMRIENTSDYATVTITRGNQLFNVTQETTVYQGVRYANMSITLETSLPEVHLDWARFIMHIKYAQFLEEGNTIALVDAQTNLGGQLIFEGNQPQTKKVYTTENPSSLELLYDLGGKSSERIEIFVGVFQIRYVYPDAKTQTDYILSLMLNNTKSYTDKIADLPLDVFDYQKFLNDWKISYVLCRDPEAIPRFVNDPLFSLVFANNAVAIFKVKGSINQPGIQPNS